MQRSASSRERLLWQPEAGQRILVFAPHPDDEVLAAGGLIETFLELHATVPPRVVVVTNGDASYATALFYGLHSFSTRNFRRIARIRQQETLDALASLGLGAAQISFWGFPDRGLRPIWESRSYADHLYASHTTGLTCSEQSLNTPIMDYSAASLLKLLHRELIEFQPTTIIMPHPVDAQPDHKALANFILSAVCTMEDTFVQSQPKLLAYMMWMRDQPWLIPMRLKDPSFLPKPKNGAPIYCLFLADEIRKKKATALQYYRSQKFSAGSLLKDAADAEYEYFVPMQSDFDAIRESVA